MTKNNIYCDHCGAPIYDDDHPGIFVPPWHDQIGGEWLDFCEDCFFKVISFAKAAEEEETK